MSHFRDVHPNFEGLICGRSDGDKVQLVLESKIPSKIVDIFHWIRWIVLRLLPFSFCEDELNRELTKLDPICTKTLKKY
jgi:hypothetical protein